MFKPEAMFRHYEFVYNDWVKLYGIEEQKVPDVLKNWENRNIEEFLLEIADPYIHNSDGCWWDIFSSEINLVRRYLSINKEIKIEDVTIKESLIY